MSAAEPVVELGVERCGRSRRAPPPRWARRPTRLHQHLVDHPDLDLTEVAYSLASTRAHHPYRAVITAPVVAADPRQDLLDGPRRPAPPANPTRS